MAAEALSRRQDQHQQTTTAKILADWFRRLAETRWSAEVFLDMLAEDLVWTATGSSPISGTFRGKIDYVTNVYQPLSRHLARWPTPIVERVVAEGDWGVVQFRSVDGLGHNGADYNMRYCWVIRLAGAKVAEVIGYYDTAKVWQLFA